MLVKIFMRSERKWRNPFIDKSMTTNEISIEKSAEQYKHKSPPLVIAIHF